MRCVPRGLTSSRWAFTLIELLLVIGIVASLVALLIPAVQKVRESASALKCQNNLHQIGLALEQHHNVHSVYPSNGGWDGNQEIKSASGAPYIPTTFDETTGQTYTWGVGDPKMGPTEQCGSWAYAILPYVEQEALFKERDYTGTVAYYICASRRLPLSYPQAAKDDYGTYDAGGWTWGKIDYAASAFSIDPDQKTCRSKNTITDGLSNTILVGEKAFNPRLDPTWYWDEPFFLGGSMGTCRDGLALLRDISTESYEENPFKNNWGSNHIGGVQFLFGDGHVKMLYRTIDEEILTALLTPDGGEGVSPP